MFKKFSESGKIIPSILFLLLIALFIAMFNPFKKLSKYEVAEIRDFSCPNMTGFTFKYPVFRGWTITGISKINKSGLPDGCVFGYNRGSSNMRIEIKEILYDIIHNLAYKQKNAKGVYYELVKVHTEELLNGEPALFGEEQTAVKFYLGNSVIEIGLNSINESSGFPKDLFWKQVIESFRMTDLPKISKAEAIAIARQDADKLLYLNQSDYDIRAEMESDGWEVSFESKKYTKGGGGPVYIIDPQSGVILRKSFQR